MSEYVTDNWGSPHGSSKKPNSNHITPINPEQKRIPPSMYTGSLSFDPLNYWKGRDWKRTYTLMDFSPLYSGDSNAPTECLCLTNFGDRENWKEIFAVVVVSVTFPRSLVVGRCCSLRQLSSLLKCFICSPAIFWRLDICRRHIGWYLSPLSGIIFRIYS